MLDVAHNLSNPLFLLHNAFHELLRWKMRNIFFPARVLAIEVEARGDDISRRDFPCPFVLFPLGPPIKTGFELLKLDRLGLCVILPAFRERMFVLPEFCTVVMEKG